jgi:hypothetical protein
VAQAAARKAALRKGQHLTPASGTRANMPAPPPGATESYFLGKD